MNHIAPKQNPTGSPTHTPLVNVILAGLEPTISGSIGRCLVHWATGPDVDFMLGGACSCSALCACTAPAEPAPDPFDKRPLAYYPQEPLAAHCLRLCRRIFYAALLRILTSCSVCLWV